MLTNAVKAQLFRLSEAGEVLESFPVQFNPESLKVNFSNQVTPPANTPRDNARGTAASQHVGRGTTKMNVQLWFDVTAELPNGLANDERERGDVRALTKKVIDLLQLVSSRRNPNTLVPPGVRFLWGSFQFEGLVESIEQSLEFFSPEGIPLRASISLSMSKQDIDYTVTDARPAATPPAPSSGMPSGAAPGTNPLTQAPAGATLQGMAASVGKADNWQAIAQANGIENPRLLAPGQLIDLNVQAPRVAVSTPSVEGGTAQVGISGFRFRRQ